MVNMGLFTETYVSMTESLKERDVLIKKEELHYTTGALPQHTNI